MRQNINISLLDGTDEIDNINEATIKLRLQYNYQQKKFIERLFYQDNPLPIDTIYVNLQIVTEVEQRAKENEKTNPNYSSEIARDDEIYWYENIHATRNPIKLKNLFQLFDKGEKKHLLIEGRAGIGKSTLCQYISYCWSLPAESKKCLWKNNIDFIFWIPLRALKLTDNDIVEVVERICFQTGIATKFTIHEKTLLNELIKEKNILWLLDGFDELHIEKESKLEALWETLLNEENVILTSRPGYIKSLSGWRRVEITGFTDKHIQKYIDRFYSTLNHDEFQKIETIKQLQKLLQTHNSIQGISHIPVNLELLCSLYEKKQLQATNDMTLTELYSLIVKCLYERHALLKKGKTAEEITTIIDICESDDYTAVTHFLEYMAFKAMEKREIIIKKELLNSVVKLFCQDKGLTHIFVMQLIAQAKELGFIKVCYDGYYESYYFIHLTFQEYFSAKYLARSFFSIQRTHVSSLSEKELHTFIVNEIELKTFIGKTKWANYYEVMYAFIAGILSENNFQFSTNVNFQNYHLYDLQVYFDWILNEPQHKLVVKELMLLTRCLEEAKLPEIQQQESIIKAMSQWCKFYVHNKIKFNLYKTELKKLVDIVKQSPRVASSKPYGIIETLIQSLNNSDNKTKEMLGEAFGEFNITSPEVEQGLIILSNDSDFFVRTRATVVLGDLMLNSINGVNRLLKLLNDEDFFIRTYAQQALGKLKTINIEMLTEIVALLKSEDWNIRRWAAEVLGNLKIKNSDIIQGLSDLLYDNYPKVIATAAEALGKLKINSTEIVQKLMVLLNDKNYDLKISAASSFLFYLKMDSPKIMQKLVAWLKDDDMRIRVWAASTFGILKINSVDVIQGLLDLLNDDFIDVVETAIDALGELAVVTPKIEQELLNLLDDESDLLIHRAVEAIGKLKISSTRVVQKLIILLNHQDPYIRSTSAESLGDLNVASPEVEKSLLNLLYDEDSIVRSAVASALGKLNNASIEVLQGLIFLLGDEDKDVRDYTVHALKELKIADLKVVQDLIVNARAETSLVRYYSAQAIGILRVSTPDIIQELLNYLNDNDDDIVRMAAKTLGKLKISSAEIVQRLIGLLKHETSYVRIAAAVSLGKLKVSAPEVINELLDSLKNTDPLVRAKALMTLGKLNILNQDVMQGLVTSLNDELFWMVKDKIAKIIFNIPNGFISSLNALYPNQPQRILPSSFSYNLIEDQIYNPLLFENAHYPNNNDLNNERNEFHLN